MGNAQQNYLVDHYDDPSLWTQVGTNVEISEGVVNFKNLSYAGQQRRVYRQLAEPLLTTDDWKFSFDFVYSELGFRSGPSVGHNLIVLTEDNKENGRLCPDIACTGQPISDTDYISVYYGNDLEGGNNRFSINSKINETFFTSDFIFFYNLNQKLYFDFEKVGVVLSLSVYVDEDRTILLNNQTVTSNLCEIAPLNFIQHCASAAGDYLRGLTGQIDNLILDKNYTTSCSPASKWYSNNTTVFPNFTKNIGIGTSDAQMKLSVVGNVGVEGDIIAKGVIARPSVWPDYVFSEDYNLKSLEELEKYIDKNAHLPGVPTEKEVLENGSDLGATNAILLEKIEELTLHLIEMNKRVKELESIISEGKK
ncbi:hypothetical protein GCM10007940_31910 [Portibacter lacus]|uniref:Uncharacterized protein n=1 Tax=Portibacter lacus TaxID=1099794 RepID=A0AA37SVK1_9BACT|nr:hypothetical protein GCM10007940_31910 [Portibacter lacus]